MFETESKRKTLQSYPGLKTEDAENDYTAATFYHFLTRLTNSTPNRHTLTDEPTYIIKRETINPLYVH